MKISADKLILVLVAIIFITIGIGGLIVLADTFPPGQIVERRARFNGNMAGWVTGFCVSLLALFLGILGIYYIGVAEGKKIPKFDNFLQD